MARTITIQTIRDEERINSFRFKPATVLKIEADYHRERLHRERLHLERQKKLREHYTIDKCSGWAIPKPGRLYIDPDLKRFDKNDPHNYYHRDR
jgi:hypothetical protein